MLKLITDPVESFNNVTNEFEIVINSVTLLLEHSLISISKWEAKYHKAFLSNSSKLTNEEFLDYIRFMSLNNVDDRIYENLSSRNLRQIMDYIDDSQSATTFSRESERGVSREIITSELIYYWMIHLNIPSEYQKWHLNRLLTLIKICNIKGQPEKKMSQRDIMNQNRQLNALRRAKSNSKG